MSSKSGKYHRWVTVMKKQRRDKLILMMINNPAALIPSPLRPRYCALIQAAMHFFTCTVFTALKFSYSARLCRPVVHNTFANNWRWFIYWHGSGHWVYDFSVRLLYSRFFYAYQSFARLPALATKPNLSFNRPTHHPMRSPSQSRESSKAFQSIKPRLLKLSSVKRNPSFRPASSEMFVVFADSLPSSLSGKKLSSVFRWFDKEQTLLLLKTCESFFTPLADKRRRFGLFIICVHLR